MNALAGFSFQLASALVAFVRADADDRHPKVLIEALSDFVSKYDGYMVITQAKLTLSSAALRHALDELWQIHELARSETPNLTPHLQYAVLASRGMLKNVEAAIARWYPNTIANQGSVDTFLSRLSVRVEPDPQQALVAHLVNAFGDPNPFGSIQTWLGRLLAQPTLAGFGEACQSVTTDLAVLEIAARERAHRFHIWDTRDRPPSYLRFEGDPEKATLTGQLPHRSHLAEGRFARRWFYEDVFEQAERWLAQNRQPNSGTLPVFWLCGRSGTGKSVALLHLLSDLQQENDLRTIIWLDQQADRIAEAIRWARPFFAQGRQIILASDDPYTAERHQRAATSIDEAIREIDAITIAYPEALRPTLLFCGPTEQSQFFEDDLADRVTISRFFLPLESQRDLDELREWYVRRTGRTELPVGSVDNVLIVQLFFEWATDRPIKEFAHRLRRRLEDMAPRTASRNIFNIVAEILALNRLYAPFPARSIDAELEQDPDIGTCFDRLRHLERHLSFEDDGSGYRLTHPHLANAIYTVWFGREEDRRYRKAHLVAGINAALEYGDRPSQRFAPLWAIARLSSDRVLGVTDARQRFGLIETELQELLRDLYAARFAASPNPLVELPVWSDLNVQLALSLAPSPIELIASAVRDAHPSTPGLRLACHKLLQHNAEYPEGPSIVAEILNKYHDWLGWRPVASDYLSVVGFAGIESSLKQYVRYHWARPTTRGLVGRCFGYGSQSAVREIVLSWLKAASVYDAAWPGNFTDFVDIFKGCRTVIDLGLNFLRNRSDHSSWSHVWERIFAQLGADQSELVKLALRWLASTQPKISGWDRVWEELWEAANDDARRAILAALADDWLARVDPGHGSWVFVWKDLWEAANDDARRAILATLADDWLARVDPGHGSWVFVWKDLWEAANDDARRAILAALADDWLRSVSLPANRGDWKDVWDELWTSASSAAKREVLIDVGLKWLIGSPPGQIGWRSVWARLWEAAEIDVSKRIELTNCGITWLSEASMSHPRWPLIWRPIWIAEKESTKNKLVLIQLAKTWLRRNDVSTTLSRQIFEDIS